jgi:Tfp pilus assembly protein PilV
MSLVELIIAIIILTVGMLGLAGVSTVVLKQMRGGSNQTIAASIAQTRFERFEGRRCSEITGGTATTRGMTETWVVAPVGTRAMSVRDTVTFLGIRGQARVGIQTVVSCEP